MASNSHIHKISRTQNAYNIFCKPYIRRDRKSFVQTIFTKSNFKRVTVSRGYCHSILSQSFFSTQNTINHFKPHTSIHIILRSRNRLGHVSPLPQIIMWDFILNAYHHHHHVLFYGVSVYVRMCDDNLHIRFRHHIHLIKGV